MSHCWVNSRSTGAVNSATEEIASEKLLDVLATMLDREVRSNWLINYNQRLAPFKEQKTTRVQRQ